MKSTAALGIFAGFTLLLVPVPSIASPASYPISLQRPQWFWSSVPLYQTGDSLGIPIPALVSTHCRTVWFNARGVLESDLNPALTEAEGAQNERTVLEIAALPPVSQVVVVPNDWTGLTESVSARGEDFTNIKDLEIWVNDFTPDHAQTSATLHIDLGDVSEDAFWSGDDVPNGKLDTEDKNGDGKLELSMDPAIDEDTGLDGLHDPEEPGYDPTTNPDPHHDDYDYSPALVVNNLERNWMLDTEDLDRDGSFETADDYFEANLDLSGTAFVRVDVPKDYAGDPDVKPNNGWRLFRIPLDTFEAVGAPDWDSIRSIRIWLKDMDHSVVLQIGGIALLDSLGRGVPTAVHLRQNHPNPFNPGTTIPFELSETSRVSLRVFDARGRLVRVLIEEDLPRGYHDAPWDGKDKSGHAVSSGVYWCRLETGGVAETRTMVLVR